MTDRQLAVVLLACLLLPFGACTSEEPPTDDRDAAPSVSVQTGVGESARFQGRRPQAYVLASGRIAYPLVGLTTWSTCPFVVESVRRVSDSTMRIVGHESTNDCTPQVRRRAVSERLTRNEARAGVEEVVVISRRPQFAVSAVVQHVVS
jgi:hypothetical protein